MVSRPHPLPMCKSRRAVVASDPKPRPSSRFSYSFPITDSVSYRRTTSSSSSSAASVVSKASTSASLAALRDSLPETPTLYPFSEIWAATNNFLSSSSSSSSSFRCCSLRGKDAVVFQRPFQGDPAALPARLGAVCKSHHSSLVRLLGTSLAGDYIYLVYEHTPGASLADCLRNPRNPNFTPLSSWMSRVQVAADLAQGLEYIHHHSATIHNRLKASSVLVTEPHFRAKILHFGATDLAGEIPATTNADAAKEAADAEFSPSSPPSRKPKRSDSRRLKIEGTRGYMAPELLAGGNISQRSDVYALGVVLLELVSGEEPLKYRFDKEHNDFHRVSLIETAREAFGPGGDSASQERGGRVRRWVDRRLRDSYPVEAAEDLIRVALRCVEAEAAARPDMTWVAGKVSKILLDSKAWEERVRVPTEFSVSIAPR